MRENNRKPIEKCRRKLPQFTTMNVIDGQAGLVIYSSLIFYSLTIDNILNIIVLLILAGVTIATLTGDNGILIRANEAKERTEQAEKDEKTNLAKTEDLINEYINGIEVEQVTDENPGILEIEGTDTYIINSIEDLVFFAYDVTNGNTYEGKTVKLGLSLDFNSTKSYIDPLRTDYGEYGYNGELKSLLTSGEGYIPIGTGSDEVGKNSFSGTFDGQENQIKNLYINEKDETDSKIGFFAVNYGNIENLKLVDVNITRYEERASLTGGLVGQNRGNATIKNCGVSGNITIEGVGTAVGIAGHSMGLIEDSYNLANIEIKTENINGASLAGIANGSTGVIKKCFNAGNFELISESQLSQRTVVAVGGISNYSENTIEECFNLGNITIKISESGNQEFVLQVGGVVGNTISETLNCYNKGNIEVTTNGGIVSIAGISGTGNSKIINCYNVGNIVGNSKGNLSIGGISSLSSNSNVTNCYYIIQDNFTNVGGQAGIIKTEKEMKNSEFVNLLNHEIEGIWKQDTNNINNGYPILSWQ